MDNQKLFPKSYNLFYFLFLNILVIAAVLIVAWHLAPRFAIEIDFIKEIELWRGHILLAILGFTFLVVLIDLYFWRADFRLSQAERKAHTVLITDPLNQRARDTFKISSAKRARFQSIIQAFFIISLGCLIALAFILAFSNFLFVSD